MYLTVRRHFSHHKYHNIVGRQCCASPYVASTVGYGQHHISSSRVQRTTATLHGALLLTSFFLILGTFFRREDLQRPSIGHLDIVILEIPYGTEPVDKVGCITWRRESNHTMCPIVPSRLLPHSRHFKTVAETA